KKIHRARIERAAERHEPPLFGALEYGLMPLPRRVRLLIETVQAVPIPQAVPIADKELALRKIDRHGVSGVSLKFHRMGAGLRDCVHNGQRTIERAIVIT